MIGSEIGNYEIVARLGTGGMAEVYKAYHPDLNRHVAIKIMHRNLIQDSNFLVRFRREARNAAALRHPHIVQVYDFDVQDDLTYMVMEYVDGRTLQELIAETRSCNQRIQLEESLRIICEVGEALVFAHRQGIIHRDVKPSNVLLDEHDHAFLADFGLAKLASGAQHTAPGTLLGTPDYMAPEQCLGEAGDGRTDLYALGVILFELATGRLPFIAETQVGLITQHINDAPPLPRSLNPDTPSRLERVILKALAKDPVGRYDTVEQMLHDIGEVGRTVSMPAAKPDPEPLRTPAHRGGPSDLAAGDTPMPIRVVLVDDQALFREGLRTLLSVWPDIEIVGEASNGEEAIQTAAELCPDVILMDLRMPVLDGVAATRRITAAYTNTRVIVLTTFDDDEHIFDGLRAGAVGYLLKDVPSEKLVEAIRATVRGESFSQPPHFLAGLAATDGGDSSHLRFNRAALTSGGVQIMVEEDPTFDSEMAHTTEPVAFRAIEGDGLLNGRSASASLWESSYQYDPAGNITSIATLANGESDAQSFSYDSLNRLLTADATGAAPYNESYSYNAVGNITTFNGAAYSYSSSQPHAVTSISGGQSFSYDANGNMTTRNDGTGSYTQAWDVENRLTQVTDNGTGGVTTFTYDAGGNRVKAVKPDGSITYTPFPNYEETVAGAATTTRVTYMLGGQPIAVRVSGDPDPANNGLFTLHNNHLGSVSAMSDENGVLVPGSLARYTPFGSYRSGGPSQITDRAYTGQRENMSLGLYYYNARYFAPGLGRFVSADTLIPDPTSPQSLNRYSYVLNSPLNFIDPSGHSECGVGQYQCEGDIDRFAELKSEYEEGDDFVFGQPGSPGVNRYVELEISMVYANLVLPFKNHGGTHTEFDPGGITVESSLGIYFGLGGALTGQLDVSSFTSPHLNPKFEAETGKGLDVTIAGLEFGGRKSVSWNSDGTQSIEYGIHAIVVGGTGGVVFDPNAVIVRPSEQLARDLASGKDEAWQQLYRSTYGSSSVLPSSDFSFINTIHSDPVFPDYGGFLPINVVYTGY